VLGPVEWLAEALGVAVFALTGALVAARRGMDPFGFALLATATGIGGGTVRDLLLGVRPVFWVAEPRDVIICVIFAGATYALGPERWHGLRATRGVAFSSGPTPSASHSLP
jgi:uncharacterized membrane protein YeiH